MMKFNLDKVKKIQKLSRENPDLALQLENDVYKAVGMVDRRRIQKKILSDEDSKEKKKLIRKSSIYLIKSFI